MLCFYEGNWSRAEIYGANESKMALGFIDYGNVHLSGYDHVMPLPRHLSHLPAISAKVHLQGLTDSPDEAKKLQSAALLKVASNISVHTLHICLFCVRSVIKLLTASEFLWQISAAALKSNVLPIPFS